MQQFSDLSRDSAVSVTGFLTTCRFPGPRRGRGGWGVQRAPPTSAEAPEKTTSPRMPCEGNVGAGPPGAQGCHFLVLKKKVAKEKKESKPQASRLGIASESGQVIIDDE